MLQCVAIHLQYASTTSLMYRCVEYTYIWRYIATHCNMLQHTATCCSILQYVAAHYNMLPQRHSCTDVSNIHIYACESFIHVRVRHDSFARVTWLIYTCDMTPLHVWHDSFTRVTWLIYTCDMTHLHVWHDSFTHDTYVPARNECATHFKYISNESCHIHKWVMSRIYISHVHIYTYIHESCHIYEWVMSDIYMSHVHIQTHIHESCHIYGWVMSHIYTSRVHICTVTCAPARDVHTTYFQYP